MAGDPHDSAASPDALRTLTIRQLQQRCKARGLREYSRARKEELLALLLEPTGRGSSRPLAVTAAPEIPGLGAVEARLVRVEARLDQLENLLLPLARQAGIGP